VADGLPEETESGRLDFNRVYIRLFTLHALLSCCARRSDTEVVSAKHQAWPHLAVHVYLDRTLEMGATEMGATIGCPLVGDSPRGTETAEQLTSNQASWAARLGAFSERSVP
jgi:hypothetical protein